MRNLYGLCFHTRLIQNMIICYALVLDSCICSLTPVLYGLYVGSAVPCFFFVLSGVVVIDCGKTWSFVVDVKIVQ